MQNLILSLLLLLLSFFCSSHAQTVNTWTGNVSSDWNNAGNWSLSVVPDSTHTAQVKYLAEKPYPVLTGNVQIDMLDMFNGGNGGAVYIGEHELKMNTFWGSGSSVYSQNGTLKCKTIRLCTGMDFFGNLTIYTDNGVQNGNVYHGDLTVHAHPHIPTGMNSAQCYPCGSMMFGYSGTDTFKGKVLIHKTGPGSVHFGIFPSSTGQIVFEKPFTFIEDYQGATMVGFNAYGGTTVFKDTANFILNNRTGTAYGYLTLRSNITFEKPVFVYSEGMSWFAGQGYGKYGNNEPLPTKTILKDHLYFQLRGGDIGLGNGTGLVHFESNVTLKQYGEGFKNGKITIGRIQLDSDNSTFEIIAPYDPLFPNLRSYVRFEPGLIVDRDIKIVADYIELNGATFNKSSHFLKIGASHNWGIAYWNGYNHSTGGNTFNGPTKITNAFGYNWKLAGSYPDVFNDSLILEYKGNVNQVWDIAASGSIFNGPVIVNSTNIALGDVQFGKFSSTNKVEFRNDLKVTGNGDFYFKNTIHTGNLKPEILLNATGSTLRFDSGNTFSKGINATGSHIYITASKFLELSTFKKLTSGNDDSIGSNIFHSQVQFLNSAASGSIRLLSGEDQLIKTN